MPLRSKSTSPTASSLAKRRTKPPSNSSSSRAHVHGPASPGPTRATPYFRKTSACDRDTGPPDICHTERGELLGSIGPTSALPAAWRLGVASPRCLWGTVRKVHCPAEESRVLAPVQL